MVLILCVSSLFSCNWGSSRNKVEKVLSTTTQNPDYDVDSSEYTKPFRILKLNFNPYKYPYCTLIDSSANGYCGPVDD